MRTFPWAACIACGLLAVARVQGAETNATSVAGDLKTVLAENFRAAEAEDVAAVKNTIHTKSPSYAGAAALGEKLFARFNLKYEILTFDYLGTSGDYAIARSSQRTESKEPDAKFRNNVVDCLYIFRQEDGAWKIWTQAVLEVKYLP